MNYYTKIASIIEEKLRFTHLANDINFTLYAVCMACIDNKNVKFLRILIILDVRRLAYISQNRQIT
jgi:hypothetical protein